MCHTYSVIEPSLVPNSHHHHRQFNVLVSVRRFFPKFGRVFEQIFYGWMPFLTPTLPTIEPMRVFYNKQ